jgi:hypothetical protein
VSTLGTMLLYADYIRPPCGVVAPCTSDRHFHYRSH